MKDLVKIIRDNPGCIARIDNDSWFVERAAEPPAGFDAWPDDKRDDWFEDQVIVRSSDDIVVPDPARYGAESCHGGAILLALAAIVGVRIEGT